MLCVCRSQTFSRNSSLRQLGYSFHLCVMQPAVALVVQQEWPAVVYILTYMFLFVSVTLLQDWSASYYHSQSQETWHILLLFITTGPGTDSAGPGDIKLLNRCVQFLWIISNSIVCTVWVFGCMLPCWRNTFCIAGSHHHRWSLTHCPVSI